MQERNKLRGAYIDLSVRDELKISNNEMILLDSILKLQNNTKYPGWCFAGRDYLAETVGVEPRSLYRILDKLIKKGLIEADPKTKNLRTTSSYCQVAHFQSTKERSSNSETEPELKKDKMSVETMTNCQSNYDKMSDVYRKDKEIDREKEEKKKENKKREEFFNSRESEDKTKESKLLPFNKGLKLLKTTKEYRKEACQYFPARSNLIDTEKGIYYSWIAFLSIWEVYPSNKTGSMKNAFASWHEIFKIESKDDLDSKQDLIQKLVSDISSREEKDLDWRRGFVPKLSRYLEGRRWEDEFKSEVPDHKSMKQIEEFEFNIFENDPDQTDQTFFS